MAKTKGFQREESDQVDNSRNNLPETSQLMEQVLAKLGDYAHLGINPTS